jgi:hypothetical protein
VNLAQLLDELRHGILHDRSDQISGDNSDYLWSNTRLIEYINQAERKFARESLCIRDYSTLQCCELQTVAWQKEYNLDQSVVAVISAKMEGDRVDLARAGHSQFQTYRAPDALFFNPQELSTVPPGKILAFGTDEGMSQDDEGSYSVVVLRTFPAPTPQWAGLMKLRVARLPLNDLCNPLDVPEVPKDHHLDMLSWAAYLALRIVDHDIGDPERAQEFKAQFEAHIAEIQKEAKRKMFTPNQWSFGRNGYSYERDYQ